MHPAHICWCGVPIAKHPGHRLGDGLTMARGACEGPRPDVVLRRERAGAAVRAVRAEWDRLTPLRRIGGDPDQ
jgi:hypothetical protein